MSQRTAIVTGANKGIGLAIVRQLALQWPSSPFGAGGSSLLIYLTARDATRGQDALQSIESDSQLKQAKALASAGGKSTVKYALLDISKPDSIKSFADMIKKEHPEGVDYVINNAGIAMQGFDSNVVRETLACNYFGTLEANNLLLPQIRKDGRLVNVASMSGHLSSKYSSTIKKRFLSAEKPEEITGLMDEFKSAVEKGTYQGEWPGAAYAVSKCGLIGVTGTLAKEHKDQSVLINSCCPGYVRVSYHSSCL
jgi:carbonyl reductase 1